MKNLKLLSLLLSVLMIFACFVSCGAPEETETETQKATETETEKVTETETEKVTETETETETETA